MRYGWRKLIPKRTDAKFGIGSVVDQVHLSNPKQEGWTGYELKPTEGIANRELLC